MAPPVKQGNVAGAAEVAKKRASKIGPTVEVRAIQRGQYGYPYARIIEPGTVFKMAVKDLGSFKGGTHPITGQEYRGIDFEGKQYGLPSWVVDAKEPVEAEPDNAALVSGRPSQGDETDDVL